MDESVAESSSMEWVENQRRFIVTDLRVVDGRTNFYLVNQAYLFNAAGWAVRVRRTFQPDDEGPPRPVGSSLAYKGPRVDGRRVKGEMPLSERTAAQLFSAATDKIFKCRYDMVHDGLTVAIDHFFFDNEGLVLAEFETEKPLRRFIPPGLVRT